MLCYCLLVQQCQSKPRHDWETVITSESVANFSKALQMNEPPVRMVFMRPAKSHRKTVKHFDEPNDARELTFSCYQRLPLLTNDVWREMLSRAIDAAVDRHHWGLTAFVFMPEHVHLLMFPLSPQASKLESVLKAMKRPYSYRIKQCLIAHASPLLQRLTVRQRPGVETFRYWQEGPGYDRNLDSPKAVVNSIDYFHQNPVRRGLCQQSTDWRWSSARWYASDGRLVDEALPKLTPIPSYFWS